VTTIDKPQEARVPAEQKAAALNGGARYTLSNFAAGEYTLLIKVADLFSGKIIEKRLDFRVKSS
jgi:hypothetical protein